MAAESRPDLPQELAVESARLASYRSRLQREVDSLTVVLEAGRVTPSRRAGQRMTRVGGDVVEREGGLYAPPTPVGDSAELRLVPAEEQVILEVEPETIVRRGFLRITSSGGTFVLGGVQPREPAEARDRVALEPIPAAGVVIMRVVPGSLADQIGFRQGDIITAAAGYSTPTTEDLNRVLQEAVRPFDILVFRDGGMMTLRFR